MRSLFIIFYSFRLLSFCSVFCAPSFSSSFSLNKRELLKMAKKDTSELFLYFHHYMGRVSIHIRRLTLIPFVDPRMLKRKISYRITLKGENVAGNTSTTKKKCYRFIKIINCVLFRAYEIYSFPTALSYLPCLKCPEY